MDEVIQEVQMLREGVAKALRLDYPRKKYWNIHIVSIAAVSPEMLCYSKRYRPQGPVRGVPAIIADAIIILSLDPE